MGDAIIEMNIEHRTLNVEHRMQNRISHSTALYLGVKSLIDLPLTTQVIGDSVRSGTLVEK